jgi:hypothetical protein
MEEPSSLSRGNPLFRPVKKQKLEHGARIKVVLGTVKLEPDTVKLKPGTVMPEPTPSPPPSPEPWRSKYTVLPSTAPPTMGIGPSTRPQSGSRCRRTTSSSSIATTTMPVVRLAALNFSAFDYWP